MSLMKIHRVLALESSFDDCAISVVDTCRNVLWEGKVSQHYFHRPFNGTVPKFVPCLHFSSINWLLRKMSSKVRVADINAVAATRGPGLANSLTSGFEVGKAIASIHGLDFLPINHMVNVATYVRAHMP